MDEESSTEHSHIAISSGEEDEDIQLTDVSNTSEGEEPDTFSNSSNSFLENRNIITPPNQEITSPARSPAGLFSSAQGFTPVPDRSSAYFGDAPSFSSSLMGIEGFPGSDEPSKINSRHFTPTRHSTMASEKERLRSSGIDLGGFSEEEEEDEEDGYVTEDDIPYDESQEDEDDQTTTGLVLNESSAESEEEYFAFLLCNALVRNTSSLDLLDRYQQVTMDQARRLQQRATGGFDNERANLAEKEAHILEQESFTWALVQMVEEARLQQAPESWSAAHYQRHTAILKWLESVSQEQERARPSAVFAAIQQDPTDTLCPPSGQSGVESRSGFLRLLWTYVRAGRMDEADKLCQDCKQWWRFGSLSGRTVAQEEEQTGGLAWVGHPHRNLWKYTCWQLSEEASFSNYERALYASCCGNLLRMFEVSTSYQDHLWACFRVLLDYADDSLLKNHPQETELIYPDTVYEEPTLPLQQGATCATLEDAFALLQNNNIVPRESFEVIQAYIIQGEWVRVLEQLRQWMDEYGVTQGENQQGLSPHLLRFGCHLYLHLQSTRPELALPLPLGDAILLAYLRHLESQCLQEDSTPSTRGGAPIPLDEDSFALKKARAIALYSAQLSDPEQRVEVYATFLSRVHHRSEEEKKLYCRYAWEAGLDQQRINTRAFEMVAGGKDSGEIEAFKFLCYNQKQRSEALLTANQLLRGYLVQGMLPQAQLVLQLLPVETITQVLDRPHVDARVENACREHFCLALYFQCQQLYEQWRSLQRDQQAAVGGSRALGDVATVLDRDGRQRQLDHVARELEVMSMMTLQFPPTNPVEGVDLSKYELLLPRLSTPGWMIDEHPEAEGEDRQAILHEIRAMALPRVLFQWEEVLASMPDTGTAIVSMAEWVTDQQWQLYRSFTRAQWQELLTRIRRAALRVLQTSRDPLGIQLA